MAHQLAQHLDRRAVVGVALGVAVTKPVGHHPRAVKRLAVAVEQRRQRGDPAAHDPRQVARANRLGAPRVAMKPREQPQLAQRWLAEHAHVPDVLAPLAVRIGERQAETVLHPHDEQPHSRRAHPGNVEFDDRGDLALADQ